MKGSLISRLLSTNPMVVRPPSHQGSLSHISSPYVNIYPSSDNSLQQGGFLFTMYHKTFQQLVINFIQYRIAQLSQCQGWVVVDTTLRSYKQHIWEIPTTVSYTTQVESLRVPKNNLLYECHKTLGPIISIHHPYQKHVLEHMGNKPLIYMSVVQHNINPLFFSQRK